jgi:hypothetical protein
MKKSNLLIYFRKERNITSMANEFALIRAMVKTNCSKTQIHTNRILLAKSRNHKLANSCSILYFIKAIISNKIINCPYLTLFG